MNQVIPGGAHAYAAKTQFFIRTVHLEMQLGRLLFILSNFRSILTVERNVVLLVMGCERREFTSDWVDEMSFSYVAIMIIWLGYDFVANKEEYSINLCHTPNVYKGWPTKNQGESIKLPSLLPHFNFMHQQQWAVGYRWF